jgi:hypothetical protein
MSSLDRFRIAQRKRSPQRGSAASAIQMTTPTPK